CTFGSTPLTCCVPSPARLPDKVGSSQLSPLRFASPAPRSSAERVAAAELPAPFEHRAGSLLIGWWLGSVPAPPSDGRSLPASPAASARRSVHWHFGTFGSLLP